MRILDFRFWILDFGFRIKNRESKVEKAILCLFLVLLASGCAMLGQVADAPSIKEADQLAQTGDSIPQKFQLHDVPHNPRRQEGTDCAPDSLRMVLNYRGKNVSKDWDIPQKLTSELTGLRGRSGGTSFQQMQQIAAKIYELPAFMIYNCDLQSLKAIILNKWPPIVSYRVTGNSYHAVVAVGYDDKRHMLSVHDPNYTGVRKIRYYDLGGLSKDSVQRISCLLVLPGGSTEEDLLRGLEKYVSKEMISKLAISSMLPMQELSNQ